MMMMMTMMMVTGWRLTSLRAPTDSTVAGTKYKERSTTCSQQAGDWEMESLQGHANTAWWEGENASGSGRQAMQGWFPAQFCWCH